MLVFILVGLAVIVLSALVILIMAFLPSRAATKVEDRILKRDE